MSSRETPTGTSIDPASGRSARSRVEPARARRPRGVPKAVILAGGPDAANFGPTRSHLRLAFPMADGRPLLWHLVEALSERGVEEMAIVASAPPSDRAVISDLLARHDGTAPRVSVFVDDGLCGSAGALRRLRDFIGGKRFLVTGADRWLDGLDLDGICAVHDRNGSTVTVVLEEIRVSRPELEQISVSEDGRLETWRVPHHSRRRPVAPTGMYLFEPDALDLIERGGYEDIKEQLLPKLAAAGRRVQIHRLERPLARIDDLEGYRAVNGSLLHALVKAEADDATDAVGGAVIGENSRVAPSAYILGPIMIGDDCTIEDGAQIIGPTVIGDGTTVGAGALVRESFVWRGCRLRSRSRVMYSVITEATVIEEGQEVENEIVGGGGRRDDVALRIARRRPAPRLRRLRRHAYDVAKRTLDVVGSTVALVALSPLMLVIAVAVRLDSRGPIFFRQTRCGRGGRDFIMMKFRSMCADAEERKSDLAQRNEARGPMFKIKADPRTTRMGRFLRRTSLDELPQLWNVLVGDMSLVGPRPLAMDEMGWAPKWRDIRLRVKPGITGLWQVYGRNEEGFEPWIEHDISYVLNRSLLLDLRILAKTIGSIVH